MRIEQLAGPLPVFPGANYLAECSGASGGAALFSLPFAFDSVQYQQRVDRARAAFGAYVNRQPPAFLTDSVSDALNVAINTAVLGGADAVQQIGGFLRRHGFANPDESFPNRFTRPALAGRGDSVTLAAVAEFVRQRVERGLGGLEPSDTILLVANYERPFVVAPNLFFIRASCALPNAFTLWFHLSTRSSL